VDCRQYHWRIGRSSAALGITLVAHIVALWFLAVALKSSERRGVESTSELFFIVEPPTRQTNIPTRKKSSKPTYVDRSESNTIPDEIVAQPSVAVTITLDVDWDSAKGSAARNAVDRADAERKRNTFQSENGHTVFEPPKKFARSAFPWDPWHGKRFDMAYGVIPIYKVGKKCVFVLVFPQCRFGGEIKPEGDLFADLDAKLDAIRESEFP